MDRRSGDLSSLARGGSLNLVGSAGGAVLSMGLVYVVARGLGSATGGALFQAIALFNIAVVVATLGADTGLLRTLSAPRTRRPPLRSLLPLALVPVAVAGGALAVGGVVWSATLGRWMAGDGDPASVAELVRVLAPFVPVGAVGLALLGATRGFGTMVPTVIAERLGRPALQLVSAGTAIAAGLATGRVALAWSIGVVCSAAYAVRALLALHRRPARTTSSRLVAVPSPRSVELLSPTLSGTPVPAPPTGRALARLFWTFTLPRALSSMFRVGVLWLDVVLVGALVSTSAAAVYTVATRLLQAGFLAVDAIGQAVEPMFARMLGEGHVARAHALYEVATGWLVGLTWPLFLTMWVFAPTLLGLFGEDYAAASSVVAILAGSALVGSGFGPVDVLLVMAGRSLWSFRNAMVAFGLNVVLNLVLIPRWGLDGAAVAWAASRIVGNVLPLLQIRSLLGLHPFGRGWFTAAAASTISFGVVGVGVRLVLGTEPWVLVVHGIIAGFSALFLVRRWRASLDLDAFTAIVGRRRPAPERFAP